MGSSPVANQSSSWGSCDVSGGSGNFLHGDRLRVLKKKGTSKSVDFILFAPSSTFI